MDEACVGPAFIDKRHFILGVPLLDNSLPILLVAVGQFRIGLNMAVHREIVVVFFLRKDHLTQVLRHK